MSGGRSVTIDRSRLRDLVDRELDRFRKRNPASARLFERSSRHMLAGVPMSWMLKWAGASPIEGADSAYPLFAERAEGAHLFDVDGHEYVDFCLGDTGAMTGHSPPALLDGLCDLDNGLTFMLPTEAVTVAAEALSDRFGLPKWQFTVSATDANRFAIRLARALTGRPRILVFDRCYHGSVDETLAVLTDDGSVREREFNLGPPVAVTETTRVVHFNDLEGLERELSHGDVACVLTEPALTNVGIVLPEPGFHDGMRDLATEHGALLILDETHTLCAGPGGYTRYAGLDPDLLTIGKAIGSGVPAGAWGLSEDVAHRISSDGGLRHALVEGVGVGGTLAGNALSAKAMAATLVGSLGDSEFASMIAMADRWRSGVERVIESAGLNWHVTQLGARAEYHFTDRRPTTGAELAAASDEQLERYLRLYLMNRGVLTTPFHNMALMAPQTTADDVDLHEKVFSDAVSELTGDRF